MNQIASAWSAWDEEIIWNAFSRLVETDLLKAKEWMEYNYRKRSYCGIGENIVG